MTLRVKWTPNLGQFKCEFKLHDTCFFIWCRRLRHIQMAGLPYCLKASSNTSTQKFVSKVFNSCQDRAFRLYQSITTTKWRKPLGMGIYVISEAHMGSTSPKNVIQGLGIYKPQTPLFQSGKISLGNFIPCPSWYVAKSTLQLA